MSPAATAEAPAETSTTAGNAPVYKDQFGRVRLAIFKNERSSKEGKSYCTYDSKIYRTYKDKGGKFVDTFNWDKEDLPNVGIAANEAWRFIDRDRRDDAQN